MPEQAHHAPPDGGGDRKFKVVYTIIERSDDRKPIWLRVGAAFVNRDQSINVKLDAIPITGQLHIRDYVPPDDSRGRRNDDGAPFHGRPTHGG